MQNELLPHADENDEEDPWAFFDHIYTTTGMTDGTWPLAPGTDFVITQAANLPQNRRGKHQQAPDAHQARTVNPRQGPPKATRAKARKARKHKQGK